MGSGHSGPVRRLGGWGFAGVSYPPSQPLLRWLEAGIGEPGPPLPMRTSFQAPTAGRLPELPVAVSTEAGDRIFHARGQGLPDLIRVRGGLLSAAPDGVCRPRSSDEVETILAVCSEHGIRVIPWGGGTSVTGGVNVLPGQVPVLTVDLAHLSGLVRLDEVSGLATFAAGTTGPGVEAALADHGLTLGHYPQSWQLATVGGWAATRSSGQESLGYGRIEDMVAGLVLAAPAGRLEIPALPASAAGPDLRHLVMGSEGRLGIITEVTFRVRRQPQQMEVEATLLPDFEAGLEAARMMVQADLPLTMLRLSDAPETEVAMAVGLASTSAAPLLQTYLKLRGIGSGACLMLCGVAGTTGAVATALAAARSVLRRHGGVALGRRPGRAWKRDRFRHPYLRDALLDTGYATDTLETAVPWSALATARTTIADAMTRSLQGHGEQVAVLCHVSHPYRDGASLYFTFFFRNQARPEQTIARWAEIKRTATTALVQCGATVSHHHGVGQWHAPWLEAEIGSLGHSLLAGAAGRLDPGQVLNPHVLLDPTDRLEL
jgi:alkyldihydroxyacetonephosphate synthase